MAEATLSMIIAYPRVPHILGCKLKPSFEVRHTQVKDQCHRNISIQWLACDGLVLGLLTVAFKMARDSAFGVRGSNLLINVPITSSTFLCGSRRHPSAVLGSRSPPAEVVAGRAVACGASCLMPSIVGNCGTMRCR